MPPEPRTTPQSAEGVAVSERTAATWTPLLRNRSRDMGRAMDESATSDSDASAESGILNRYAAMPA